MSKLPSPSILRPNYWILGPKRDLVFFILTPLFILPVVYSLKNLIPVDTLGIYVLGLGGFGHHLPGFIRAYADPGLFRRHKARFILIPLALLAVAGLYSIFNLNALACVTVAWGTWHGAMQVHGFMRIYDSKARSIRAATARLDWLMCIGWFGLAILHSPARQFTLVTQFYVSGGFLIPPWVFPLLRQAWDAATILVTLLFLSNAYRRWKAGNPASPIKFLVMASSFAFWWYCTAGLGNLLLGVVLWEVFHDVQYNALVWLYQRRRVDAGLNVGRAERILFQPGWWRLGLYALLILGYGYIGVATSFADINMPEKILLGSGGSQWLLRVFVVSALLHFYYDGFIWKIRESSLRKGLGLREEKEAALPAEGKSGRGWQWAFFAIPVLGLGAAQYRGWGPTFESQVVNLSEAVPGSWIAHFLAGTYYKGRGFLDPAETQYRRAVRYNPGFAMGHLFLGDVLYKRGDLAGAVEHYRRSVELDSSVGEARRNLGWLYLQTGQPRLAEGQFRAALAEGPENPDLTFGLASALLRQDRRAEAGEYAEKTLRLVPNHSGALNHLGMIRQLEGDLKEAVAYYQKAIGADSGNASARQNLAEARAGPNAPAARNRF